jgi:hypothetical protein
VKLLEHEDEERRGVAGAVYPSDGARLELTIA